jgi:hypothetical protein
MISTARRSRLYPTFICRFALLSLLGASLTLPAQAASTARTAACSDGATRLCLLGRFLVEASWRDAGGRERAALAVALESAGKSQALTGSGAFSFFDTGDADLLVRLLDDGQGGPVRIEAGSASGTAFELHVVDTTSGAQWIHTNDRGEVAAVRDSLASGAQGERSEAAVSTGAADLATGRMVADWLESAESGSASAFASAAALSPDEPRCVATATDLCLQGGRLRVQASIGDGARAHPASLVASGADTGVFRSDERSGAAVAVRVVDGRTVNGRFWLLYSALGDAAVEIEIADLATGNRRRLAKAAGAPASEAVVDALSASAATVSVELDRTRAAVKAIGEGGGFLEATDARGTKYRLVVPKGGMFGEVDVTMTPVAAIGALPFSGGLGGAVYIEPEDVVLPLSAQLTITPSPAMAASQQLPFAFRGLAGELFLTPPIVGQAALVLPIHRLGGFGVGAGSAADLTAQLGRLPTLEDDAFLQRIAGLTLTARRAANGATALPATVLPLLQADFTARVRPRLATMKAGNLDATFPPVRNWRNAARDAGLDGKLSAQAKEIKAAEVAGARVAYLDAGKRGGKASPTICDSPVAAGKMYRAFKVLVANGAQKQVKMDDLLRCARFELRFDSTLVGIARPEVAYHDEQQAIFPLLLDIGKGMFFGGKVVNQYIARVDVSDPYCTATKKGPPLQSNFDAQKLLVPAFYFRASPGSAAGGPPILRYRLHPASEVKWSLDCRERPNPITGAPAIPASQTPFSTTWTGAYTFLHLGELNAAEGVFFMQLEPPTNPLVYYERKYLVNATAFLGEDTVFLLLFTPQ